MNKEDAILQLKEAQEKLYEAIGLIEYVTRYYSNSDVTNYLLPYLRIRAGENQYVTRDYNLDNYIEYIKNSVNVVDENEENIEEGE